MQLALEFPHQSSHITQKCSQLHDEVARLTTLFSRWVWCTQNSLLLIQNKLHIQQSHS
jgi:hypothetical protein